MSKIVTRQRKQQKSIGAEEKWLEKELEEEKREKERWREQEKEKAYQSSVVRSSACIPLDCKAVVY